MNADCDNGLLMMIRSSENMNFVLFLRNAVWSFSLPLTGRMQLNVFILVLESQFGLASSYFSSLSHTRALSLSLCLSQLFGLASKYLCDFILFLSLPHYFF